MHLAAFAGVWKVERRIEDRHAGRSGRFSGTARFRPEAGGLAYREEGVLELSGAPAMAASRGYHWSEDGAGTITVRFEDGRHFHSFDAADPAPEASHDCVPDAYRVRYDFTGWPEWRAAWSVSGPRKDYVMETLYVRARAAGEGP